MPLEVTFYRPLIKMKRNMHRTLSQATNAATNEEHAEPQARETAQETRALLKSHGLRVTRSRIAVLELLIQAERPLSCAEVTGRLGADLCDPATVYRSLIKFVEVNLIAVVSRIDGVAHYQRVMPNQEAHSHPHFICDDCGEIACLPATFNSSFVVDDHWALAIQQAQVQLRGECPDCIQK